MLNPYENLWIYYLQGAIKDNELEKLISINDNRPIDHKGFIGNWEEDGFSFLFFSAPSDDLVQKIVEKNKTLTLIDRYEMTGEAWHGEAIESYRSGTLCISPPWKIASVNKPDVKHILLDPGVVFGTGRHPTTEDCLGYIEYLCNAQPHVMNINRFNIVDNFQHQFIDSFQSCVVNNTLPHRINIDNPKYINKESIVTAMDIGTGTGLLAIAAAKLGCKKVLAVDFNLLAVKTAKNNIKLNSLEDKILAIQGRAENFVSLPADLVVANIHYDVMRHLLEIPQFIQHKWLILSGLLRSEVGKVITKLKEEGVEVVETTSPDGVWNTILAKGKHNVSCNSKADAKY